MPTRSFGRWLVRQGIVLPVPLMGMYAINLGLDPLELNELAPPPRGSLDADRAAQSEGLSHSARKAVIEAEPFLREPEIIAYVARLTEMQELSAAALFRQGQALLLVDGPDEVQLEVLGASAAARSLIEVLPTVFGAPIPTLNLSADMLRRLQAAGSRADQVDKVTAGTRVDPEAVKVLLKLQREVRASGMMITLRPDDADISSAAVAEWFEGASGAVLKGPQPGGGARFKSADRPELLAALSAQLASLR